MRFTLTLATSLFISSPVLAQSADSVSARYEEGRASGVTPQTRGEYAMCHAYWSRWKQSVDGDWEPHFTAAIIEPLQAPAVQKAIAYWDARTTKAFKKHRDQEPAARAEAAEMAEDGYNTLMLGYRTDMFETLGTCAVPD